MSVADRDGIIWLDGEFVPWRDAKVHVLTHTLHYGVGVFEGIRAYQTDKGTAIFRLQAHTDRLFNSAKILQMPMPYDKKVLIDVQQQILIKNKLSHGYIRPIVFYSGESLGLHAKNIKTHVAIAAWEWGKYLGEDPSKGIRIKTSSITRHHINSVFCRAKAVGNYINSVLALQEVTALGYDEALLLDQQGYVAEGTGENIFMVRNGNLYSPNSASSLEGITRDTILILAKEMGLTAIEKPISRDEFYVADEAFFTGTAAEVTPIGSVDDRIIGDGNIGPITKKLQKSYFDVVTAKSNKHSEWLTFIKKN
jgi:branched-chain amino acid aminotransferase